MKTRRQLLLGTMGLMGTACAPTRLAASPAPSRADAELRAIEARVGGRVGVYAFDTGTGEEIAHRADERFAMCSTFKWVVAAAVLAEVDRTRLSLTDEVTYGPGDLLDHSPVTRAHVGDGRMTLDALAEAAVTTSDNAAGNLLLAKVGGPAGFTSFVRAHGDSVTRLDRDEPSLNENAPNDPRDTTSPRAMARLMSALVLGDALSTSSRERLTAWLRGATTGKDRLRAGLPSDWNVGDKTGTGQRNAVNDVAIAWRPGGAPIVIAAYLSDGGSAYEEIVAAHADVGRSTAQHLARAW